jgi:signal transduction histidine kinase
MGVDDTRRGTPPQAGDGPARWLELQEALLRGLAHALGNRVGMVAGVADLLGVSAAPSPRMITALREEADRLEALLRRLRGVPRGRGGAEPVVLAEALAEAEAQLEDHPAFRDGAVPVTRAGGAGVVHAPPGAVGHALCVALVAAAARGPVTVTVAREAHATTVTVTGGDPGAAPAPAADVAAMAWLLADAPGCVVEPVPGGVRLGFPARGAG